MKRNLILMAGAALLILFLALWGPAACQKMRSQEAQSKVDSAQSGAFRNSAADAINTQSAVNQRERESESLSRSNEEEIRNAKGADQRVDPAANAAGLRALCRRPSRRNDPACRVQQPDPR